jgi:hypothetical protein
MLYFKESERGQWFRNWVAYCQNLRGGRTQIIAGIGNWLNSHDDTLVQARLADERLDGLCFYSYASTNPFPGLEAELFNEQFYTRLGDLPRAPAPQAKDLPPVAGVFTLSTKGDRLNGWFEGRVGLPFGFQIRVADASVPVVATLQEAQAASGMFLLPDVTVLLQIGDELRVTDGKEEATVRLTKPADLPFLPRDRIAILGRMDGGTISAQDLVWIGVSAADPVLAGTKARPW